MLVGILSSFPVVSAVFTIGLTAMWRKCYIFAHSYGRARMDGAWSSTACIE